MRKPKLDSGCRHPQELIAKSKAAAKKKHPAEIRARLTDKQHLNYCPVHNVFWYTEPL